jgi:hypothetical protein
MRIPHGAKLVQPEASTTPSDPFLDEQDLAHSPGAQGNAERNRHDQQGHNREADYEEDTIEQGPAQEPVQPPWTQSVPVRVGKR